MLVIASQEILNVELHEAIDSKYTFDTAKEWCTHFKLFISEIKDNIAEIMEIDSFELRDEKLKELGVIAVPYLVEEFESGDETLESVISTMITEANLLNEDILSKDLSDVLERNDSFIDNIANELNLEK